MSRFGVALAVLPVVFAAGLPAARAPIVVVTESGVEAYNDALAGATAALPAGGFRVIDLAAKDAEREFSAPDQAGAHVWIAIGSRALSEVRARHLQGPVIAALALRTGEPDAATHWVDIDVPLAAQLPAMRALWPGRTRAGLIRGPGQPRSAADTLEACARKEGFSLEIVDCEGPAQLLKALSALKSKVDFIICQPNGELYNAATIKPLVLASLEQRLPLVGFSPAFVRAGAAAGMFADYREVGRQAADMALRATRGEEHIGDETPRKLKVAVNQRVAHLLGVDFHGAALSAEVYK